MDYKVRTDEHNGILHAYCPYCSKMHQAEEITGVREINGVISVDREPMDIPNTCKRCGCPMDNKKSLAFANAMAEGKPVKIPEPVEA